MIDVSIRAVGMYQEVKICSGGTTIDLGLLNDKEVEKIAERLVFAAYGMSPDLDSTDWLRQRIESAGIKQP